MDIDTTMAASSGGPPVPLVVHQIRDLAAVLRREAGQLRSIGRGISAYALAVDWQSNSSRVCLDELSNLVTRLADSAGTYDSAALVVLSHADQVEATAAQVADSLINPVWAV
ncbi:MAG: hypothetical protein IPI32_07715 [Austwickia sp.]|jgi:hypothetical protein|nr:hypothetical protein [Austwickia sp.]MBK8437064.1 hypothetical protein [Austwickia sp.]MBK9102299.1 hypothetical protein [Austwickia sp.]